MADKIDFASMRPAIDARAMVPDEVMQSLLYKQDDLSYIAAIRPAGNSMLANLALDGFKPEHYRLEHPEHSARSNGNGYTEYSLTTKDTGRDDAITRASAGYTEIKSQSGQKVAKLHETSHVESVRYGDLGMDHLECSMPIDQVPALVDCQGESLDKNGKPLYSFKTESRLDANGRAVAAEIEVSDPSGLYLGTVHQRFLADSNSGELSIRGSLDRAGPNLP